MSHLTRRSFFKRTLAAAATITIAGTKSSGRVLGANETIRLGIAGLHGRGSAHLGGFVGLPNVQITYLIDPDTRTYAARSEAIQKRGGNTPRTVQDIRTALDDQNLDAISIATPNHWHALMTMWACQAGKDVYVEKPCSHNVAEGRLALELARKHRRIVQHGTQSRNEPAWARVVEIIKSGKLGRLLVSRALCYKRRGSIGMQKTSAPPSEVDFNLWLGPARQQEHHANLVHYNWHWFWDFGNGDIGNQGVHQMDIARWAIPQATLPTSVVSVGGRFGYRDQGETPNTQISVMEFGRTQLVFEVRGLPGQPFHGQGVGNIFHLEGGIIAGNNTFYPTGSKTAAPMPTVQLPRTPSGNIFRNFIDCVRSRRTEDLDADILEGHYSSACCHLANISYRLGVEQPFNGNARPFGDNKDAAETFARMQDHLRDNSVQLAETNYRVGPMLAFDPKTETFARDQEAANRLLTRANRPPFVVNEASS